MKKYQGLLLGHLGNEPEQYYIDSLYGFLIAVKGESHYVYTNERWKQADPVSAEKNRWIAITFKEAKARLELAKRGV